MKTWSPPILILRIHGLGKNPIPFIFKEEKNCMQKILTHESDTAIGLDGHGWGVSILQLREEIPFSSVQSYFE